MVRCCVEAADLAGTSPTTKDKACLRKKNKDNPVTDLTSPVNEINICIPHHLRQQKWKSRCQPGPKNHQKLDSDTKP